mmetsp:Transcript_87964/g.137798  ORF Transcript_87964/g.137798 Transcript_87964/m.137798 type:complete len:100 (-) Transcript_87964:316-615(-)
MGRREVPDAVLGLVTSAGLNSSTSSARTGANLSDKRIATPPPRRYGGVAVAVPSRIRGRGVAARDVVADPGVIGGRIKPMEVEGRSTQLPEENSLSGTL